MNKKISKNKIIVFTVLLSFMISFSFFYIFLEHEYDLNNISKHEISFYSQFPDNKKNIFIIGSSHLMALNSTYMNNIISEKNSDYKIYNLAKGSDSPKHRIDSLDLIISSNPEIIFYGIGYRDFLKFTDTSTAGFRSYSAPSDTFFEPKLFIENHILKILGYYTLDFDFLENPKRKTIEFIKNSFSGSTDLKNQKKQFEKLSYLPLWQYEIIDNESTAHFEIKNQSEINKRYSDLSTDVLIGEKNTDRNIQSLRFMIEKFSENEIRVILCITPYNNVLFHTTSAEERLPFSLIMDEISREFDISMYSFLDKYKDENIWHNFDHIALNKEKYLFENDFIELILMETN
jgi:hypothetical protein